jgi:hypothetical protein
MTASTCKLLVAEAEVGGLRVTVAQLPGARTASGVLHIRCGYAHDPVGRGGTAHSAEHLRVANVSVHHGLRPQAVTQAMWTRFLLSWPATQVTRLCRALVTVFAPVAENAALLSSERRAVLIEMARLDDQVRLRLAPAVAALSFPGLDGAGVDTATPAVIRDLRHEEIEAFASAAYRRERGVLTLVGPQDPDALLAAVAQAVDAEPEPGPAHRPGPQARLGMEPDPAVVLPPPQRLRALGELLIAAVPIIRGAGADAPAVRDLTTEAIVGPGGVLESVAASAGAAVTGCSVLDGVAADVAVAAWPDSVGVEQALAQSMRDTRADPPSRAAAGARRRLTQALAWGQQTPAGLARLLAWHAAGRGIWPEPASYAVLDDRAVGAQTAAAFGAAAVWRLTDGHLTRAQVAT